MALYGRRVMPCASILVLVRLMVRPTSLHVLAIAWTSLWRPAWQWNIGAASSAESLPDEDATYRALRFEASREEFAFDSCVEEHAFIRMENM